MAYHIFSATSAQNLFGAQSSSTNRTMSPSFGGGPSTSATTSTGQNQNFFGQTASSNRSVSPSFGAGLSYVFKSDSIGGFLRATLFVPLKLEERWMIDNLIVNMPKNFILQRPPDSKLRAAFSVCSQVFQTLLPSPYPLLATEHSSDPLEPEVFF